MTQFHWKDADPGIAKAKDLSLGWGPLILMNHAKKSGLFDIHMAHI